MIDTDVSEYRRMTPTEIAAWQRYRYDEMIIMLYGAQLLPLIWADGALAIDGIRPLAVITGESVPNGYMVFVWMYQQQKD